MPRGWTKTNTKTKVRTKKKVTRRKMHRAYGSPNANQILLAGVVVVLLFVQLLLPKWSELEKGKVTAGLAGIAISDGENASTKVAWNEYCNGQPTNLSSVVEQVTKEAVPLRLQYAAQSFCVSVVPSQVRKLTSASIALAIVSVVLALYLHLGSPSRRQIVRFGVLPAVMLLMTAILDTTSLVLWQQHFSEMHKSDCFAVAIASAVIAYLVAIAVAVRWRWPGICAVGHEQLAFEERQRRFSELAHELPRSKTASSQAPSSEDAPPFYAIA